MRRLPLRSPPRVRGKDPERIKMYQTIRITPACAGKSTCRGHRAYNPEDHPRVCGEKGKITSTAEWQMGSPPRMRGKVDDVPGVVVHGGITPAYAGKSQTE